MKRNIIVGFVIALVAMFTFNSCGESPLKKEVREVKKTLPERINDFISWDDVSYNDGTLEMTFGITKYIQVNALKENPQLFRQNMNQVIINASGDFKKLIDMLKDENAGIKFTYVDKNNGQTASLELTAHELKELSLEEGDPMKLLEMQVEATNVQLPLAVDEVTTLKQVTIENNYVVYNYTIDEDNTDISMLKENESILHSSVKENLYNNSDPTVSYFIECCKNAGTNLIYRYVGSNSNEVILEFKIDV